MYASSLTIPGDLFADVDDLRRQMEQVFTLRRPSTGIRATGGRFPLINIGSTPEVVEVYAFTPGVATASLEVSIDKGLLTIAGERPAQAPETGNGNQRSLYAHERPNGAFRRIVSLPEDADPQQVEASHRNGVLHIRVHRLEAARPRRIEVR